MICFLLLKLLVFSTNLYLIAIIGSEDTKWLIHDHKIVACGQLERETFIVTKSINESAKVGDEIDVKEPGTSYCFFPAGTRIKYKVINQVHFYIINLLSSRDLPLRPWRVKSSGIIY